MRVLYHFPLCPFSRVARLALAEKKLEFSLIVEKPWQEREEFIRLNPAAELPVLIEPDEIILADVSAITEYLEEVYQGDMILLYPGSAKNRAEIRRILQWINRKFYEEVTLRIVWEKYFKPNYGKGHPDPKVLRLGSTYLGYHLKYFSWILETRNWIGGNYFSVADLALAAHLSCIDFLGGMPWEAYPLIKNWYACIKSRPSFRPLLMDRVSGLAPSIHYMDLDF